MDSREVARMGGHAAAKNMTPEQRTARARKAVYAMHAKRRARKAKENNG